MKAIAIAAVLAAAPAGGAEPERPDRDHGFFFNRPGATLAEMRSDLEGCEALARGTANRFVPGAPNPIGIATSIFLSQISASRQRRINRENCMLVARWRVFAFTRSQGASWRAMTDEAREQALGELTGAETPRLGAKIREWNNDYAEPALD